MKKTFTSILMATLLCATSFTNQSSAVVGFDPDKFETMASQTEKKHIPPYEGPLNDALNELKDKIRSGEIKLDGTETEKKVSAFIKTVPPENLHKYNYMNFATTLTLIPKIPNMLSKEDAIQCLNEIKNAHIQLIEKDPNFSPKFKTAIKEKMEKLYLFIPGITHTADDIVDFHMDELKLNDKGELENLKEWNDSHASYAMIELFLGGYRGPRETLDAFLYVENPALIYHPDHPDYKNAIKKFEELKKNGTLENYIIKKITPKKNDFYMMFDVTNYWSFFSKNAEIHNNTNYVFISPSCTLKDTLKSDDDNYIKNTILSTFGHEITHFILYHFKANNKSLPSYLQILLDGDKTTYKEFCEKYGREYHEGDELNHELVKSLREQAMEKEYENRKDLYKDKEAITTASDQVYIETLYQNFAKFVEKINTGLIFPNNMFTSMASPDIYDSLKGKPIKLSGEIYFGECMADVFGTKAAKIAAEKLSIPQTPANNIYANWFLDMWDPIDIHNPVKSIQLLYDKHPIYPYRFRWMYKLSQIDPDMFGFKNHLAGIK